MLLLEWQCILKATGVCLYLLWYNIWYKFNKKSMFFRKETVVSVNFTHLHVHTEYSLLDGSNKIKRVCARVKELGMDSAAITDHASCMV